MNVHLTEKGQEKTREKVIKCLSEGDIAYKENYVVVQNRKGRLYILTPDDIRHID